MNELLEINSQYATTPFKWGAADCCTVVSQYIEMKTGEDLRKVYGDYTTEKGAKRALIKYGNFEDLLDSKFKQVDANFIQRGDIVLLDMPTGPGLGLRYATANFAMTPEGWVVVNHTVIRGWRIE